MILYWILKLAESTIRCTIEKYNIGIKIRIDRFKSILNLAEGSMNQKKII